jgi:hypothetical protein
VSVRMFAIFYALGMLVASASRTCDEFFLSMRRYYNQTRTHLALNKDASLQRPVQSFGRIAAVPVLAGLHHQYVRI